MCVCVSEFVPLPSHKKKILSLISTLILTPSSSVIVVISFGDFSEILCPSEVSGGKFNSSRACLFANMMATYGLMDLDRFGGFFTWRKNIQSGGHLRRKKT